MDHEVRRKCDEDLWARLGLDHGAWGLTLLVLAERNDRSIRSECAQRLLVWTSGHPKMSGSIPCFQDMIAQVSTRVEHVRHTAP